MASRSACFSASARRARASRHLLIGWAAAASWSCSVYDESLLEGQGGDGAGASGGGGPSSGGAGPGGATSCSTPADCPGMDAACRHRTCDGGVCSFADEPARTKLARQTPGDCVELECDGMGAEQPVAVDTDVGDDDLECTSDACENGLPSHEPKPAGSSCSQNGGTVCTAEGVCVECIDDADCASLVCDEAFECAPAMCGDTVKNGGETDVDCGGPSCPKCVTGSACLAPSDCLSGACTAGQCAATCSDGAQNQSETDIDCGGPCPACEIGQGCGVTADCSAGSCVSGTCACSGSHLLISELRTRGLGGAADEFFELYNPTSAPVVLDASWKIQVRGASAGSYADRWIGKGATIAAKGHFLIANSAYSQAPALDDSTVSTGTSDAGSVRLVNAAGTVDAVCFYFSATTLNNIETAAVPFDCEGTPVSNLPHNDSTSAASNSDASIERKPGAALGNCIDTGDSAADWKSTAPSLPQSTTSPPT